MYFPYVRGRQYELLALRELAKNEKLSEKIIPIIEPVKLSATLLKTMSEFTEKGMPLALVCNPAVGSFSADMKTSKDDDKNEKQAFINALNESNIIKTHIVKSNSLSVISNWAKKTGAKKSDWIVINNKREFQGVYDNTFGEELPQYVLIPDESAFRRQVRRNRVLMVDRFNKCDRNSDYLKNEDEFYSDDHIFYKEDGFNGFSDYSVIGKDYLESGFAPYAVAIHIVYFDKDKKLRIHHFVSDTNEDIQNPAGKFYEAVTKLNNWVIENDIPVTSSLQTFIDHYNNQTYPGLGSVKKLSLMHHLELIGEYLDKEE